MTQLLNIAKSFSGLFFTVLAFVALYMAVRFILNKQSKGLAEGNLIRQVILMTIVVIGIIAVMLALPMPDDIRANIMSLLGIVLSAIFALSSVSFMGNMLAGFMLRTINNFRSGDFIEVESYFGRVSERGLFHTELQTIDRSLITLPNLFWRPIL